MFATAGQAWVFLAMVYGGLLVGLLYDGISLLRRLIHAGLWLTGLLDFLFWVGAACILALAVFRAGGDGLRGYMLLGFASGGVLYGAGVHALLLGIGRLLGKAWAPVARFLEKNGRKTPDQEGIAKKV